MDTFFARKVEGRIHEWRNCSAILFPLAEGGIETERNNHKFLSWWASTYDVRIDAGRVGSGLL